MPSEPLDHVQRVPLPWRHTEDALTECGLPAASYKTLTRAEMVAKIGEQGKRRAALSSCMTCWTAMDRGCAYRTAAPVFDAVEREVNRFRFHDPERLDREFRALAMLAEAHREDFDTILRDMDEAIDLTAARAKKMPQPGFRGRVL
jgi:hypothetical protein